MKFARQIVPIWLLPLLTLSALSVVLFAGRVIATGSYHLAFLNWNLFLAWVPLVLAWWLKVTLRKQRWVSPKPLILSLLWLVFLPNSFYVVTDFIHLSPDDSVSLVYDAVMIMSFALSGLLLGCKSVYMIHAQLESRISRRRVYDVLGSVFLLSGFAIYLGRHLQYNTWDLWANPFSILIDITGRVASPSLYSGMYSMTLLFFVYISVTYACFYWLVRGGRKAI